MRKNEPTTPSPKGQKNEPTTPSPRDQRDHRDQRDLKIVLIDRDNFVYFRNMFPEGKSTEARQKEVFMFGAVQNGAACGVMVVGMDDESAEIMWMYVALEYRNRGIATAMLDRFLENAEHFGVKFVHSYYGDADVEKYYFDKLLYSRGFEIEVLKTYNYRFTFAELLNRPRFIQAVKSVKKDRGGLKFRTLKNLTDDELKGIRLDSNLNIEEYDKEYSSVAFGEDGVLGYLLVMKKDEKTYNIERLMNYGDDPLLVSGLIARSSYEVCTDIVNGTVEEDCLLTFQNMGNKGRNFAEKVFLVGPDSIGWFHSAMKQV